MKEKECFKCGKTKPLDQYYRHAQMGDGHLGKCKACTRNDVEKRRKENMKDPEWVAREAQRHRDKAKAQSVKFPEKQLAHNALKGVPSMAGANRHHWSYRKEHRKDIIYLHTADHRAVHRHTIYDQERMMYRTQTGELLDTKERAIEFYATLGVIPCMEGMKFYTT